jgi:ligand-binding sensor domain-containing protein
VKTIVTFLFQFVFVLCSFFATAQEPYSINYSIGDGLPSSNIYSVFQEKNGIIWFTSDVGIIRYNSKTFELFNTDNGLTDNEVFSMNEDIKGRIWLQTANGKMCYLDKGKIINENKNSSLKKISGNGMLMDFLEDNEGRNYYAYRNGEVFMLDKNDSVSKISVMQESLIGMWKTNDIYAFTTAGIFTFKGNPKKTSDVPKLSYRISHTKGKTFISAPNNLFDVSNGSIIHRLTLDKTYDIIKVKEDENKIWFCTRTGLLLYENNTYKTVYFKDYIVSDILKDKEGNYWITSLNKGVLFVPSFSISQLLKEVKISCLAEKNNEELWAGDYSGNYYVKKQNTLTKESLDVAFRKDKVTNIRISGDTVLVAGKGGVKMVTKKGSREISIGFNDMLFWSDEVFFATTFTAKIKRIEFNSYDFKKIDQRKILNKRTNVFCSDDKGNLWVGTNFGLHKYTGKDSITYIGSKKDDLSASIEDLYYDTENKYLLVATASKGLIIIKDDSVYKKANVLDGLNSNTVTSIKKIGKNTYLIGGNNGINKMIINTEVGLLDITNFNSYLGIKNRRIEDIEMVNDTLYLATDYGLLCFSKNILSKRQIKPSCIITDVNAIFEEANKINYFDNSISISFNGISFIDLGDVKYFYKLGNQEKEWFSTKESQINYKSLPAGKYTFSVYCINGFGEKSPTQTYSFEVLPPFWQKWWFRISTFLFFVMGLVYFLRSRFLKQRKKFEGERIKMKEERDKAKMEKQVIELEQKALRLQMNPHFIFNALNTIKGYYAEGDFVHASNYIVKFSKLLRKLLENEEQVTTLDNEIEMLRLYIELTQIRYLGKFDYAISLSPQIEPQLLLIPNLLLQPLVENAIIYGLGPKNEKGFLNIVFEINKNNLLCIVDDDGIGREAALISQAQRKYKSKAGEIIRERLALFDKTCTMEYFDKQQNNKPAGTKVIITMPIKKTS